MPTEPDIYALLGDIAINRDHLPQLEAQFATRAGVVPFVGAGLSAPFGFPQWSHFLLELAREVDDEAATRARLDASQYEEAAGALLEQLGARRFQDLLAAHFGDHRLTGRRIGGAVGELLRLPPGPIITTNFDRVLETAFAQGGRRLTPYWHSYASKGSEALQQDKPFLLKLHGDWDHPTTRVLTLNEYTDAYGDSHGEQVVFTLPVPTLLFKLLTSRCCLFLGCSLKQDRTIQLLHAIARGIPDLVHYAIVERPQDEGDRRRRAAELSAQSIRPVWYPHGQHEVIEPLLRHLATRAAQGLRQLVVSLTSGAAGRPRVPNNIPSLGNATVGRQSEVAQLLDMLRVARLVSITGVGGCGKSRLAIEVAAVVEERYPCGIWLVPLADLAKKADREAVLPTRVGRVVGAAEQAGRPPHESLAEHLGGGPCLLVLDNCEHLVGSTRRLVSYLLEQCPDLTILTTSRRPLELPLERLYPLAPLRTPRAEEVTFEEVSRNEAVQLFVLRARERSPSWTLRPAEAPGIAALCRALDGIPLAIEVAAARLGVLTIDAMAAQRDQLLTVLGNKPSGDLRTWTLTSALRWSYGLLKASQQRFMRAMTVFDGGWSLDAALAVCPHLQGEAVLDLLQDLHDHSLVVTGDVGGAKRFRYLEPVRQTVQLELADAERAEFERRHAMFFRDLAERAAPELLGGDQARWLETLQTDVDNLRAAIRWAVEQADAETGLRLVASLWRFTEIRGFLTEGRERARQVLALRGCEAHPALWAKVLNGAGVLAYRQADLEAAESKFSQSLELEKQLGNEAGIADLLNDLGNVTTLRGDYTRARDLYAESLALQQRAGNTRGAAVAHYNLGWVALEVGDHTEAERLLVKSLDGFRAGANERESAFALNGLGRLFAETGRVKLAAEHTRQSLEIRRRVKDTKGIAESARTLAFAAVEAGDDEEASGWLQEGLALCRGIGDRRGVSETFELLACLEGRRGRHARATELYAAAGEIQRTFSYALPPARTARRDLILSAARTAMGDDEYHAAWRRGTSPGYAATVEIASRAPAGP